MNPELLTPDEAADILRLSRSTIYELLRTGALPSLRIRRSRRVRTDAIRAFIDERDEEREGDGR